ncbi:MAG: bifunctional DNA-formamidopyrimidine glycosylase/DNA-(apurinic or apyrimidinic site) lyase [Burkholderiaceae bacterium]
MPELPEVEVTRMGVEQALLGATIDGVRMGKPLRWPLQVAPQRLVGQRIQSVQRRGKYLLLLLSQGVLLVHLGMSGSVRCATELGEAGVHDHFDLFTTRGVLRLTDPRRFGAVVYAPHMNHPRVRQLLGHLGVEPLGDAFNAAYLHEALRGRSGSIKQVLLAGLVVVGVGNIYVSESLFRAGIHPLRQARRVARPRLERLVQAIREVLQRAIVLGGSSLRDFKGTQGGYGDFQHEALVYGRAGQPCVHCATPIRRVVQGQRSTFYCVRCQT